MKYEEAIEKLDKIINNIPDTGNSLGSIKMAINKEILEKKHDWIEYKKKLMFSVGDGVKRGNKEIPKHYSELINKSLRKLEIHKEMKIQA